MSFWCHQFFQKTNENNSTWGAIYIKVHILWKGHKILQNLHGTFVLCSTNKVKLFRSFFGRIEDTNRHFEINWPLHHLWTFPYTILILSKPKGFDGLNLMAALLPIPMVLPVFEFVLPVVLICWLQTYWHLPYRHS